MVRILFSLFYLLCLWFVLVFFLFLNFSFIFCGIFLLRLSLLLLNGLLNSLGLRRGKINKYVDISVI